MKQLTLIISSLLIFGSLVACSSEPAPKEDNQQEQNEPKENTEQATDDAATKQMDENEPVAMIKEKIELKQTQEEVKELFGEPDLVIEANSIETVPDHGEMWNYYFTQEGYSFNGTEQSLDIEGLKSGKMKAQLTIGWENGVERTVGNYSIYYLEGEELFQYRVSPNGAESLKVNEETKNVDQGPTWEVISRQRYVEGVVEEIIVESKQVQSLSIQEENFYVTDTDPLDVKSLPTEVNNYVLKGKIPNDELPFEKGDKIIMFYSEVNENGKEVLGGEIVCYMKDGIYYNLDREKANVKINNQENIEINDGELKK